MADQRDVAGYTLERREGDAFVATGEVPYIENGSEEVMYQTSIPSPTTGGYYRVRQTDFAGTYSLSNTVYVPAAADLAIFRLHPNPAADYVRLSGLPEDTERIELRSLTGQLLRQVEREAGVTDRIPLHDLPAGVYLVSTVGSKGRSITERLVVR